MTDARRILVVAFAASLLNMALLTAWQWGERMAAPDWRPGEVLFVWFYVFLVTAFGLSLLWALMSFVIPRFLKGHAANGAFVVGGAALGWLMFAWTPDPRMFTAMGALTAALFAILSPAAFRRGESHEVTAAA
ncbi:hypothetical protein [Erythrobacter sp.]|uniref:hypothetical protein n=1 Tax=Erythrobacter sp. TaxID=1042 RepID=UPI001425F497|nr:hypothetical protein [Erythrobacter sp.]QIQ85642.1 MAG: hypothetical protein G9473_02280 [Erythrobacter sp.]